MKKHKYNIGDKVFVRSKTLNGFRLSKKLVKENCGDKIHYIIDIYFKSEISEKYYHSCSCEQSLRLDKYTLLDDDCIYVVDSRNGTTVGDFYLEKDLELTDPKLSILERIKVFKKTLK